MSLSFNDSQRARQRRAFVFCRKLRNFCGRPSSVFAPRVPVNFVRTRKKGGYTYARAKMRLRVYRFLSIQSNVCVCVSVE